MPANPLRIKKRAVVRRLKKRKLARLRKWKRSRTAHKRRFRFQRSLRRRNPARKLRRRKRSRRQTPVHNPPEHAPVPFTLTPGVNLVGYNQAEMGLGEGCRLTAAALETAGIPFGINNFNYGNPSRASDTSWQHKERPDNPYRINLFHINGISMPAVYSQLGSGFFQNRFNIGLWAWELTELPDEWRGGFRGLNEIWVPTTFVQDAVSLKSGVPVVRIPYGIRIPGHFDRAGARRQLGLPDSAFLFLSMYDVHSSMPRKNPLGSIEAFKRAFPEPRSDIGLVIKINNAESKPDEIASLREAASGFSNIYLLETVLSRQEVYGLIAASDAFVSLHRSEGFGLVLAEAMYLGVPVIGTLWSGNTDFMNAGNCAPVSFEYAPVGPNAIPYKPNQLWAEPDLEEASRLMRRMTEDIEWRNRIASKGQSTIRTHFSPEAAGQRIRSRLQLLGLL